MDDVIVLRQLPNHLKQLAESKINNIISPNKIQYSDWDENGLQVFLKDYDQFEKILLENFLLLDGKRFNIQPLVVPLTIYDVERYVKESVLLRELSSSFNIRNLYPEKRNNIKTGNYRIIIDVLTDEDFIPQNHLYLPCRKEPFMVDYYCRSCRENGHSEYSCIMSQTSESMPEQKYNLRSTLAPGNIKPSTSQSANYNEISSSSTGEKQKDFYSFEENLDTEIQNKPSTSGDHKCAEIQTPSFERAAMRASENIMTAEELEAFLRDIWKKTHPVRLARRQGINIHDVIEKLEAVEKRYNELLRCDTKKLQKLKAVKMRINGHLNCKECL